MFNCVRQTRFKQRSGVEAWKKTQKKGVLSTSKPFPTCWVLCVGSQRLATTWARNLRHVFINSGVGSFSSFGGDGFNMDEVQGKVTFCWTRLHLTSRKSRNVVSFATATESCCVPFQCGSSNIDPGKKRRACVMYIYIYSIYIHTHLIIYWLIMCIQGYISVYKQLATTGMPSINLPPCFDE